MSVIDLVEQGWVPDPVARLGMRALNFKRLWDEGVWNETRRDLRQRAFRRSLVEGPLAAHTDAANAQHYEVPAAFFQRVLGRNLKYSCCLYPTGRETLDEAEDLMLQLTCERAGLVDGMRILELGCGWGSLSLWMAKSFPGARITAVSNSASQKAFIDGQAQARGLTNLRIVTADMNDFTTDERFDRVVSVEMFEHMRNYELLLSRVRGWCKDDGRLFVHYFCHRDLAYPFETEGEDNWMARYFFTGGIMPSYEMLKGFPRLFSMERDWYVDGTHYERTSNHWLAKLDADRMRVGDIFRDGYGADEATLWVQRWRMFFMAVAELFGTRGGTTWGVGHYLLAPA
jgi:cyclopropane-fatty-acyl-phospholipid synthase